MNVLAANATAPAVEVRSYRFTYPERAPASGPGPPLALEPARAEPKPPPLRTAPDRARRQAPKPVSTAPGEALPSLSDPAYDAPGGLALAIHAVAHRLGVHPVNVTMSDVEHFYEARRAVIAAALAEQNRSDRADAVQRVALADAGWTPLASNAENKQR